MKTKLEEERERISAERTRTFRSGVSEESERLEGLRRGYERRQAHRSYVGA